VLRAVLIVFPVVVNSYPYIRKCAFDVGDYGMGFVANSLQLGCDCLGHIKYFDGVVNNAQVCLWSVGVLRHRAVAGGSTMSLGVWWVGVFVVFGGGGKGLMHA
jgi:hypothetical protein